jgi:hypothetical protein
VVASQTCLAVQAPPMQVWSVWQVAHAIPPIPQAESAAPATHCPAWQQPTQFEESHPVLTQLPFLQSEPVAQASQLPPPRPQAASAVPPTQSPLGSQQPEQVAGPHGRSALG